MAKINKNGGKSWPVNRVFKDKPQDRPRKPATDLTPEQLKLIEDHLKIAEYYAKKTATRAIPEEDRFQDACLGLIEAAKSFDPSKGVKFSTYCVPRVRGAIIDAEREGEGMLIRVTRTEYEKIAAGKHDKIPNIVRILPQLRGDDYERSHIYLQVEDPRRQSPIDVEMICRVVRNLGETKSRIIDLYYRENLSMRQIGEALGYSESAVSQIHGRIIDWLRGHPRIHEAVGKVADHRTCGDVRFPFRQDVDSVRFKAVVDKHGGDKKAAAAELGVSLKTVYNRLNAMKAIEANRRGRVAI